MSHYFLLREFLPAMIASKTGHVVRPPLCPFPWFPPDAMRNRPGLDCFGVGLRRRVSGL